MSTVTSPPVVDHPLPLKGKKRSKYTWSCTVIVIIAIYINLCFAEQGSETSKQSSASTVEGNGILLVVWHI